MLDIANSSAGTVMQKNEGGWNFKLKENVDNVILTVPCGRYLDTSLIDIDANPKYIIITIKGKVAGDQCRSIFNSDRFSGSIFPPKLSPVVVKHKEPQRQET